MKVLLDNCVDVRFAGLIVDHEVQHTLNLGWGDLSNGKLIAAAEDAGFEVLVTVDKNIQHQQNIAKRRICLITLNSRLVGIDHITPLAGKLSIELANGAAPGTKVIIDA
ncbi:MAG: hypothetical protein ACLQVD_10525 [Capsulimonadaceae bacterium]